MVVQELIAKLSFEVDQTQADRSMDSWTGKALKFGTVLYVAKQAADALLYTLKTDSEMENLTTSFKVLLGNLDAAKYLMQEINTYANISPFETEGVARGVKMLMAAGVSANDALATVKKLGDVALGDQTKLDRLSLVVSQVKSMGRLQGDDLRQMAQGANFNPLKFLAEARGVSEASLRKLSEKGKISYDDLLEAMDLATAKGAMFYKGAEEGAKTLSGLWSTLKDNFKLGLVELSGDGTGLYQFFKDLVAKLIELSPAILDAWRQLSAFMGVFASDGPTAEQTANGIAAAFMSIADAVMTIGTAFQFAETLAYGLMTGLAGLVTGLVALVSSIVVVPLKLLSLIDEKIATLLRKVHMFPGVAKWLTGQGIEVDQLAETAMTPARFMGNVVTGGLADETAAHWDKFNQLGAMIGGNKGQDPNKVIKLTDDIKAALAGKNQPAKVDVNVNTNIYADGALKDILEEQANDIIGLGFQTRLIASLV